MPNLLASPPNIASTPFRLVLDYCGYGFLTADQKIRKDIFLYKVGLSTPTGLVQQPVQIVVRYRSHNLTLFVRLVYLQPYNNEKCCPPLFIHNASTFAGHEQLFPDRIFHKRYGVEY